jgi:hypothetical protein
MFQVKTNPLSSDISPFDNQVNKSDDPLPIGNYNYIFCGKKGSGKSTLMLNLLKRKSSPYYRIFDKVFLCSPTAGRDEKFAPLIEELSEEGQFYDTLNDDVVDQIVRKLEASNEEFKKEHPKMTPRNLLIIDDCIHLLPSSIQHSSINQLFTNQRHMKLSIWICTQQFTKLNRLIRTNADLISFFPTDNRKEFQTLEEELSIDPKLLKKVYDFATDTNNGFLHISLAGRKPSFFKKFDKILI